MTRGECPRCHCDVESHGQIHFRCPYCGEEIEVSGLVPGPSIILTLFAAVAVLLIVYFAGTAFFGWLLGAETGQFIGTILSIVAAVVVIWFMFRGLIFGIIITGIAFYLLNTFSGLHFIAVILISLGILIFSSFFIHALIKK